MSFSKTRRDLKISKPQYKTYKDMGFGDIRFGIVMFFKVWDVRFVYIYPGGFTAFY